MGGGGVVLKFLIDFITQAPVLLAVFTVLGLVFLKKKPGEIFTAGIKTMAGFLILGAGAGILTGSLTPFGKMITEAFHIEGIIPNNEAMIAFAVEKYGVQASLILIGSMGVHLIIARFSPIKFIFLSGHLIFYMSAMLSIVLNGAGLRGGAVIISASLITGLVLSLSPLVSYWAMPKITGMEASYALAQHSNLTYSLSGLIGRWIGKDSPSTENLKLPQSLGFLKDTTVAISITMLLLYSVCAIMSGQSYVERELSNGQHYLVFSFMMAITFTAGVSVLFYGIGMIIDEIIPAFKGISEKLVPGAIPALDCPAIFPFAPNAVILGFLSSLAGGFCGLIIQGFLRTPLIIPGIVPHFFMGATAGIFGNSTGGIKGCIAGAFVHGLISSFLPLILLPFMGEFRASGVLFSDPDTLLTGALTGWALRLLGY